MKELFIQNSTLNGSLKGSRFVYEGKEAPKPMPIAEETLQQSISPQKLPKEEAKGNVDKDMGETKAQERTFMEKAKLKMGMTTEARLDLEHAFDKSPTKKTADSMAADLMVKANEAYATAKPGMSGEKIFADLAKEYNVTYEGGALPSAFVNRVMEEAGVPRELRQPAIVAARTKEMVPAPSEEMLLAKAEKLSDLQRLLDNSKNPEMTLSLITNQLAKKVNEIAKNDTTGKPEMAFAAFAKNLGIDTPVVWAETVIVPRILRNLNIADASVLDTAIASAQRMPVSKPSPVQGVERMVAQKAPTKAPMAKPANRPAVAQAKPQATKAEKIAQAGVLKFMPDKIEDQIVESSISDSTTEALKGTVSRKNPPKPLGETSVAGGRSQE